MNWLQSQNVRLNKISAKPEATGIDDRTLVSTGLSDSDRQSFFFARVPFHHNELGLSQRGPELPPQSVHKICREEGRKKSRLNHFVAIFFPLCNRYPSPD